MTATRDAAPDAASPPTPSADEPSERPVVAPPRRRRRPRSGRRGVVGTPARRGRLLVGVGLLALAVAAPLVARSGLSDARAASAAMGAERAGAAGFADEVASAESVSAGRAERAAARAAAALDARNEQRHRLAALGLNEATIDAFLAMILADTEAVEQERDRVTADVDRQAGEIPTMEDCLVTARQAINRAFNTIFDPNLVVPGPAEVCRAILAG
ncbi:hypothetical protein HC251_02685 [Iamia sp. SCSIO 61187]|uniref:hypothetical protein n=1 Tax=Iamia sp. SCSIO 61187 TaxID=2722752 RepID=UPI001C6311FF|nr:hypothetical protein [Iamia sp. SCSIO 61187]QYG91448.1 hypothetical protein HC251_02685 [Iamia sp. SCSIO 61187]